MVRVVGVDGFGGNTCDFLIIRDRFSNNGACADDGPGTDTVHHDSVCAYPCIRADRDAFICEVVLLDIFAGLRAVLMTARQDLNGVGKECVVLNVGQPDGYVASNVNGVADA